MDTNNKKDGQDKDSSGNKKETKVCPECGSNMMKKGYTWVCENCKHEMPA